MPAKFYSKASVMPDLSSYMDKKVMIRLQSGRRVSGILRGYDVHMNVTLQDAWEEEGKPDESVQKAPLGEAFIRGSMIVNIEQRAA